MLDAGILSESGHACATRALPKGKIGNGEKIWKWCFAHALAASGDERALRRLEDEEMILLWQVCCCETVGSAVV